MAFLSHNKREIRAKIVYYGPGLSGKTSNAEYIFRKMRSDHRGDLLNLSTRDRTLFFDFLPVELGNIKGYKTSFHIFTVPGQVFYNETRKAVLQDVDGLVFVADSQKKMRDENLRSLKNLEENLVSYGKKLSDIPHVFQYNKRDMPDIMSVEELHLLLNKTGAPFFEAVATDGTGVLNTLKLISKLVLKKLATSSTAIEESEEAFEEENYGLSSEYVALKPGEHAPASVKAVTAVEVGVAVEEIGEETPGEVVEAGVAIEEVEEAPAVSKPVTETALQEEPYEAEIEEVPLDESEIPVPPHGTEWSPPSGETQEVTEATPAVESEEGVEIPLDIDQEPEVAEVQPAQAQEEEVIEAEEAPTEEPELAEEVLIEISAQESEEAKAQPAEVAETSAAEVVEEGQPAEEAVSPSAWEVKEPVGEQPAPPPPSPNPVPQPPAQSAGAKEIKLYQWGFPERIDVNTIRIPIFFRDDETGEEFWSYITIGLEHIYKRH